MMGCQPRSVFLGAVLALLLVPRVVFARTWYIAPDGTGDAPTIQAGIDSAQAGDEVLLAAGRYTWTSQGASGSSMIRMKPGITLRSESGPEVTILDAEFSTRRAPGRGILCHNVGSEVRIEGLTIENGFAWGIVDPPGVVVFGRGGGIYAFGDSRPTIANCIVRNNHTGDNGWGGGIACEGEATITNCQILNNVVPYDGTGGGVFLRRGLISQCTIKGNEVTGDGSADGGGITTGGIVMDCRIEGNLASAPFGASGGGIVVGDGSVIRCLIVNNRSAALFGAPGGGVFVGDGTSAITDCVFIANTSAGFGGALSVGSGGHATILGCTIIGNRAQGASGPIGGLDLFGGGTVTNTIIAWSEGAACSGNATYTCTNLYGNSLGNAICGVDGGGNFSADPEFCAEDPIASRNVTLQSDSPCALGNHPGGTPCGLIGAGTVGCSTVDVQERSWGAVKALYR